MPRLRRTLAAAVAATLSAFTVTAAVPASAAPPDATYTVSTGPRVEYRYPTDTPASPYIDKDGTFYFQQSAALYGANDPRYWDFFTGTNFDNATRSSAISNAVNPANSLDRNNDTTWRCNNSPTGVEATPPPSGSGYSQKNYCDLVGVWVDPDTGYWYGLVHNEFTPEPWGKAGFSHYDALDVAVSTNQGKVWKITGHAITSPYSTRRGDTAAFPNQTWDYGDGDPRLFVDVASGYFYVYYASRIQPKPGAGGGVTSLAHVARAPMSSKMATGSWKKWFNGSWTEPGVGGRESNMLPVDASNSTGYTPVANDYNPANTGNVDQQIAAGTVPRKADLLMMNIAYNAYLGLYIGEPEVVDQSAPTSQRYYVTDDLSTQKWHLIGDSGAYKTDSWYRWMLDGANKTNSTIVGKTYRSYCAYFCGGPTDGEYHDVTIGSSAPAAPPADPTRTYRIGSGNGRILAQVSGSDATTSIGAATGSKLEGWVFTGLGDGSYRITNAATGKALGVNSNTTAARAWGTKPTATTIGPGGPSVGQQWFILRNSSGSTYRLINRYSGLALGLSADSGRLAETTPGRTWTNTTGNPVGGSRTAAEQTLTLRAFTVSGS
ncbi:RICIN domain-containing protein [Spirillospora sp. NPDC049652]